MNLSVEDIKKLIGTDKEYRIYKTSQWKLIKTEVLEEFHYECSRCKSKGIIQKAQMVHHVNHVQTHPEMAYEKYYIDVLGRKKRNLIPLCNECHNEVHKRFGHGVQQEPLTEEKW